MKATLIVVVLAVACAAAPQKRMGPGPVTLGVWCNEVAAAMCHTVADRCLKGMASLTTTCLESMPRTCMAGRDPYLSAGRNGVELDQCVALLQSLSCAELGGGINGERVGKRCAATPP